MPGSSTPTRDGRSQRLTSKPYDRPSSRPSSAPSTPQRPAGGAPGLLRSLVDKLYSPFRGGGRSQNDEGEEPADEEMAIEPPPYGQRPPIQAIRDTLVVSTAVTPEKSTRLLGEFYEAKRRIGQAGQQTPQEQQAIDELLRRASMNQQRVETKAPSSQSTASDSPLVSRTGRGLFESPARRRLGSPARFGTPQPSPKPAATPLSSSSSPSRAAAAGSSGLFRSPRRYAGPGLPAARTTVASSLGREVEPRAEPKPERSLAAQTLQDILKKVDAEVAPKVASPIMNPYEGYRFHIGSDATPAQKQASSSSSVTTSGKKRTSLKARTSLGGTAERPKRVEEMTDLEIIQASADKESYKKSRVEKPKPQQRSESTSSRSSPEFEVIDPPPKKQQATAAPAPAPKPATVPAPPPTKPTFSFNATPAPIPSPPAPTPVDALMATSKATPVAPPASINVDLASRFKPSVAPAVATQSKPPPPPPPKAPASARDQAFEVPQPLLPTFVFRAMAHAPTLADDVSPSAVIKARKITDVPTFTFSVDLARPEAKPSSSLSSSSSSSAPAAFSWNKPVDTSKWTCSTCDCKTDNGVDKCSVCETPRPGSQPPKAATIPNLWAATPVDDTKWTCTLCNCKTDKSVDKCSVCESPRPAEAPKASFSGWSAPPADDTKWTCSLCSCKTDKSVDKCSVCESPRPGASSAATTPAVGFTGWGAGSAKPASSAGKWTCKVCDCKTDEGQSKCSVCETPRS